MQRGHGAARNFLLQDGSADAGHGTEQGGGSGVRMRNGLVACGLQHSGHGSDGANVHFVCDALAFDIVADGIQRNAGIDVPELCLDEGGGQSLGHAGERVAMGGCAGGFDGHGHAVQVFPQERLQE